MLPGTANTGRPYRSACSTVFMVPLLARASATQTASLRPAITRMRARNVPQAKPD